MSLWQLSILITRGRWNIEASSVKFLKILELVAVVYLYNIKYKVFEVLHSTYCQEIYRENNKRENMPRRK